MNTYIQHRPKGMPRRSYAPSLFMLIACLLMSSCVNLQHVSEYATTAVTQLKTYDDLGYSFSQSCDDACALTALRKLQLQPTDCHCQADSTADSVTTVIYKGIKSYYDGLAKLSDKDLGKYKMTGLAKSLQAGSFGSVTITKPQATAYTALAGIVADAIAGAYRAKKVKGYIEAANTPIQTLLQTLSFTLRENLEGKLNVQQQRLQDLYFDMANDKNATQYERTKAIEDYRAASLNLRKKQAQLELFTKGLDKLAKAHQTLYEERNKLTLKECQAAMSEYSDQIGGMVEAFKKIKTND